MSAWLLHLSLACVENGINGVGSDPKAGDSGSDVDPGDSGDVAIDTADGDSGGSEVVAGRPEIEVTPLALDLGSVEAGASSDGVFGVQNLGDAVLTVSGVDWASGDVVPWSMAVVDGIGFPRTLDPGEAFDVVVTYAPSAVTETGSDEAAIAVGSDDADEPSIEVAVAGRCEAPTEGEIGDYFVVITDDDRALSLHFADGAGGFTVATVVGGDPGEALDSPLVGDTDGDGTWNALARGSTTGTLYAQAWDGGAWVQDAVGNVDFPPQTAGDFDGDGTLDLAGLDTGASGRSANGVGDGTFDADRPAFDPGSSWSGYSWRLAPHAQDVDGDGRIDLLAADYDSASDDSSRVWLLAGNGDGTFADPVQVGSVPTPVNGLDLLDLNADGALDVVGGLDDDGDAGQLFILAGDGTGGFGTASASTDLNPGAESGTNGDGAGRLAAFDWTGDSVADLLCTYQTDPYSWDQEIRLVEASGGGLGAAADVPEAGTIDNIDLAVPTPL